jgi:hypothetical protein
MLRGGAEKGFDFVRCVRKCWVRARSMDDDELDQICPTICWFSFVQHHCSQ